MPFLRRKSLVVIFMYKRAVYEIFVTFFLVITLIFSIMFVLFSSVASTSLYADVQRTTQAPLDALMLKDALFFCHRMEYLDERLMEGPCPAKNMLHGFIIRQLPHNDCQEKQWDFSRSGFMQTTPFIISIEQEDTGQKCLGVLEIKSGGSE